MHENKNGRVIYLYTDKRDFVHIYRISIIVNLMSLSKYKFSDLKRQ